MGESRAREAAEAEVLCVELWLLLLDIAAASDDDAAGGAGECRDVLIERAGTEEDPTDVMVRIFFRRSCFLLLCGSLSVHFVRRLLDGGEEHKIFLATIFFAAMMCHSERARKRKTPILSFGDITLANSYSRYV